MLAECASQWHNMHNLSYGKHVTFPDSSPPCSDKPHSIPAPPHRPHNLCVLADCRYAWPDCCCNQQGKTTQWVGGDGVGVVLCNSLVKREDIRQGGERIGSGKGQVWCQWCLLNPNPLSGPDPPSWVNAGMHHLSHWPRPKLTHVAAGSNVILPLTLNILNSLTGYSRSCVGASAFGVN